MYELFKKHKTKILIIIAAVTVLTAAFFMGENPNNSVQIENSTSSNSAVSEFSKNENTNKSDISVLSSTESSLVSSESKQKEQSTVSNNNSETSKDSTVNSTSVNENTSTAPIEHSTYTEQPVTENSTQKPNKNENTSNNSSALNSTNNKPDTSTVIKENSTASPSQTPTEQNTCTISISCATILDNMDKLDSSKKSLVSSDGCILDETTVTFQDGDSVFDVLKQTCTDRKIHLEFSKTPLYNSYYVEGINNIYEFDCGSASGWLYRVNGTYNSYASSECKVKNGDKIEWLYTCNLGKDIDGYFEE